MTFLQAEERAGNWRERLTRKIDTGSSGECCNVVLDRIKIGWLAFEPSALCVILGDNKSDRNALADSAITFDKYSSNFEKT